jgi:RNA polymerase sigma factor (sigma-70 family)
VLSPRSRPRKPGRDYGVTTVIQGRDRLAKRATLVVNGHFGRRPTGAEEPSVETQPVETQRGPARASATASQTIAELDDATSVFVRARPRLLKIAYRILRDMSDAEDVVQEAWLRWQTTDRTLVLSPPALLATTTTRLAINVLQSARRRRELSASPWLPEPGDTGVDPETAAEQLEAVEQALLLLMERLTPTERAAFILREGLGYPYRQASEVLHLGVANVRQLVKRAHQRLATNQRRRQVDSEAHRRLVRAFLAAAQVGNLTGIEELLSVDVGRQSVRRSSAA